MLHFWQKICWDIHPIYWDSEKNYLDMNYRFIGIIGIRTFILLLLIGAIPFLTYYFGWELLDQRQELRYNALFSQLMPWVILLTLCFMVLGTYISMEFVEIKTDEKNCTIRINSALRFFIPRKVTFRWDEVDSMMLDEDIGRTTLSIFLRGSRQFDISYSLLLRGSTDFRAFVSTLGLNTGL